MELLHGRWKIKVSNNVVMQCFADSWNEEAIIAYIKEFKEVATPLTNGKWAIISVFEDWELGVPEIEHHVVKHCDWFKANGCIKDCHVYTPDAIKQMQLEKMIPHTEQGYERCVFANIDDAVDWLDAKGFPVSNRAFLDDLSAIES